MHLAEVYDQLFSGETLKLKFYSKEEAEYFRVKLAQFKSQQEKEAVNIGMMVDEEILKLSFAVTTELEAGDAGEEITAFWATVVLKQKAKYRQYHVVILPRSS